MQKYNKLFKKFSQKISSENYLSKIGKYTISYWKFWEKSLIIN